MSGIDEKPSIIRNGKVFLPLHMRNKVTVVHKRFTNTTICRHLDCVKDDEYMVYIGPKAKFSTLEIVCCEEHLKWAVEKVYETWTNLHPKMKKYYEWLETTL